jgi:hypothetical protein
VRGCLVRRSVAAKRLLQPTIASGVEEAVAQWPGRLADDERWLVAPLRDPESSTRNEAHASAVGVPDELWSQLSRSRAPAPLRDGL